ncbi:MAG: hypothetical protein QNK19_18050 [Xanthomonadales bacterium]|nr:hypothetical protein [Xanthomonadales bacterium]
MKTWVIASLVSIMLMVGLFWMLSWATQSDSAHVQSVPAHSVKYETRDISDVCGQKVAKELSEIIKTSKSCTTDEDCVLIEGERCPFSCGVPVNKLSKDVALSAMREYVDVMERACGTICQTMCKTIKGITCEHQKCKTISGLKNTPPAMTEPPPVPSYDGET